MTMIRVSPETLKEQGLSVQQYAQESRDLLQKIEHKIQEIHNSWDGLAQSGYAELYGEAKRSLMQMPDILEGLSKATLNAAHIFADVDQKLQQQFRV